MDAPQAARARPWTAAEGWDRHREEITQLWRTTTLRKTMEHMEREHGFHATERMYKFRIKNWGLKKNWGDARVKRALDGLEKDSSLSACRTRLDQSQLRNLKSYLARCKPDTLQQLQAAHGAALQKLLLLEKTTWETQRTGPDLNRDRPLRPRPAALRAPTQLALPDEMFRLLSAFLAASGSGDPSSMAATAGKLPEQDEGMLEFVLKFRLAHTLISDSHHASGFACLSVCFAQLSAMLVPRQPLTLLYVLNAALEVSTEFSHLPDILALLFRHVRSLADIRLGPRHPATEIARRFGALERDQHVAVLGLLRELQSGPRRPCHWQVNEVAFSVYDRTVGISTTARAGGEREDRGLVGAIQQLLTEWEVVRRSYIMTLWLRMRMMLAMLDKKAGGEEEVAVRQLLKSEYPAGVPVGLREPRGVSLTLQCYKIRARMWIDEGRVENARSMYRMGRALADTTWGEGNDVSMGFIEDARRVSRAR